MKPLSLLALSVFTLISSSVLATTPAPAKSAKTEPASAQTKSAQSASEKRFYRNLEIKFLEQGAKEKEGKAVIFTRYAVKNRSQSTMKGFQWAVVYTVNGQPIHYQEVGLNFPEPYLKGKQQFNLEVELGFDQLSNEAKKLITTPGIKMASYIEPKSITFEKNNFVLEVKK